MCEISIRFSPPDNGVEEGGTTVGLQKGQLFDWVYNKVLPEVFMYLYKLRIEIGVVSLIGFICSGVIQRALVALSALVISGMAKKFAVEGA